MDSEEHSIQPSFGTSIRFTPFSDSRQRVMTWTGLPNRSPYCDFPDVLYEAVGISGVRINHRDLNLGGDLNYWKPIRIDDVKKRFVPRTGRENSISYLSFDLELRFTYIP